MTTNNSNKTGLKQITVQDVRTLKISAVGRNDRELAARCDRAIAGEQDAWWLVRCHLSGRDSTGIRARQ